MFTDFLLIIKVTPNMGPGIYWQPDPPLPAPQPPPPPPPPQYDEDTCPEDECQEAHRLSRELVKAQLTSDEGWVPERYYFNAHYLVCQHPRCAFGRQSKEQMDAFYAAQHWKRSISDMSRERECLYGIFILIMLAREQLNVRDSAAPCNDKITQFAAALASLPSRPLEIIAERIQRFWPAEIDTFRRRD